MISLRSKFRANLIKTIAALFVVQTLGVMPVAEAVGPLAGSVTFSRNETTGIVTVNWTAPSDTSTVTGYKVAVDASGAGKNVSILVSGSSSGSTTLCFPFTGNLTAYVASTVSGENPTFDDGNTTGWKSSATQNGYGNVSSAPCATSNTAYNYTVNFYPGTGSGTMASMTGTAFAILLPANAFTGPTVGSTFLGWATSPTGGVIYNDLANINLTANTTLNLYAKWSSDVPVAAITYAAGGGSGSGPTSPLSVNVGETITVTANTFTRSGYTFSYWSFNSETFTAGSVYPKTGTVGSTSTITFTANWSANEYVYDGNTASGSTASQTYAGTTLNARSNGFTAPTGYTFDGWCSTSPSTVSSTCGGTKYAAGAALPAPGSPTVTLYAVWVANTPAPSTPPAPVYVPHPPTISSISSPEVCAVGSQLTLKGTYLSGATAKVDGISAQVLSSNDYSMLISLPARSVGTKTIVVTNADGSASTTVKYKFVDSPIYVNYTYPETFKDKDFSYTFTATNAEKYSITGIMPAGLTLNPLTGEISGAPTVEGDFVFTIVASNFCDETYLNVYMFVDKAIPSTFTCSVAFNVPKSDNISDIKLSQLKTCLSKITTLTPKYIEPIIYLSGGVPDGLSPQEALVHPRYLKVIDFIKSIGLDYQIYVGAFGGTAESIQFNVYWPTT